VTDPYAVLGVLPESDDEAIRKRYLELVREFSPEHHPARFAAIRAAYEQLSDQKRRVEYRLFEQGKRENIEQIIEEVACRTPRRRFHLNALMDLYRKGAH